MEAEPENFEISLIVPSEFIAPIWDADQCLQTGFYAPEFTFHCDKVQGQSNKIMIAQRPSLGAQKVNSSSNSY